MATALNPAPGALGLASPALGPWFTTDINLAAPNADLSVSVALAASNDWLPPAAGVLSLYISTTPRPRGLASLRSGGGSRAFTDNQMVALFTLLPEVEDRLAALAGSIPPADGSAVNPNVPSRARVRYFAIEMSEAPAIAVLEPRMPFALSGSDADKADTLGLKLNGTLGNGAAAMSQLVQPGIFNGDQEKILKFSGAANFKLWAFDEHGRAVDPGAVAAWWNYLATVSFNNLWGNGINGGNARTSTVAGQLTVQLTNAHEGPLADPLLSRLQATNLTPSTGLVRSVSGGTPALSFSTPPSPDDAPVPKMALAPTGQYSSALTLWPTGAVHASLARDFIRVAAVDVEQHLVGQPRIAPGGATAGQTRRAADQNRTSTCVTVGKLDGTVGTILQSTTDGAAAALMTVLSGGAPAMFATSVLDRDWGPLSPVLPAATLPAGLPAVTVSALTGGGTLAANIANSQRVLIEFTDPAIAGCWVRAWPQGFDFDKGVHTSMDGGAGIARPDGSVSLVATLPDGEAGGNLLGVNVIIVAQNNSVIYPEVRFNRPNPVGGSLLNFAAATGQIVACELGQTFANPASVAGVIAPGTTLFSREPGGPALIDPATVPATAFVAQTAIRQLGATDRAAITQPAYKGTPDGATAGVLATTGATVPFTTRNGLVRLVAAAQPLPTQERLEVFAAAVDASGAAAALGSTPTLGRYHEVIPHQSGHPGAPAAPETHGSGALIVGPAAVAFAEHARDRVNPGTPDLAAAAGTPFAVPADPAAPVMWAAALKTVAAGTEGEVQLSSKVRTDSYPFGDTFDNLKAWYTDPSRLINVADVPATGKTSAARALDRRALAAGYGLREAATSLAAVFARAEDYVYIESPAIDDSSFGETDDTIAVWQALKDRMDANPSLRVIICVPIVPFLGCPNDMKRVRDGKLLEAIANLNAGPTPPPGVLSRAQRTVVFSPSAGPRRHLRIAATTVIVDDVYALTGTTHLWRRGLSFDSSLAVSLFDESVTRGRCAEVQRFRRAMIGGRLGLSPNLVPNDPAELVDCLRLLLNRNSIRLATDAIPTPELPVTATDNDIWNRDGSAQTGFNPVQWITDLAASLASLSSSVNP